MKKFLLLSVMLFTAVSLFGQSKAAIKAENEKLKQEIVAHQDTVSTLRLLNKNLLSQIDEIRKFVDQFPKIDTESVTSIAAQSQTKEPVGNSDTQCAAITQKGTRCSRPAQTGSKYCWQHQNQGAKSSASSYSSSHNWQTGPRGGQYYINSKGNKVYRKR